MTQSDFENALVDVRKAYRLIYLYQRRVMDIVQYIGDTLSFRYAGGWSWFSNNTPKGGKGALGNWAWDWLNMYFYEFNFSERKINDNLLMFSIFLQSDTGYYDSNNEKPLFIESFHPAEESSTKLIFLVGKNCWHKDYSDDFEDTSQLFKKDAKDLIRNSNKGVLLAKVFPLSDFLNLDTTTKCLAELIEFLKDNGIAEIEITR
jgi:hypothetical protein